MLSALFIAPRQRARSRRRSSVRESFTFEVVALSSTDTPVSDDLLHAKVLTYNPK